MSGILNGHNLPATPEPLRRHLNRSTLLSCFALACLAGNLLLQQFAHLPSGLSLFVFAGFVFLYFFIHQMSGKKMTSYGFLLGLLMLGVYSGFARAWIQGHNYLQQSAPAGLMAEDQIIAACVSSLPQLKADTQRFIIEPLADPLVTAQTNLKRIRVSVSQRYQSFPNMPAGSCWDFPLRLKTTRGLRNTHGFDYELYLYQQGVGATAYLRATPVLLEQQAYPWLRFRVRTAESIKNLLPEQSSITPLILGLTLGVRDELSVEHWAVLQKAGTSHLLAISGLHIGIAALFGFYVGKLVWLLIALSGSTLSGRPRRLLERLKPLPFGLLLAMVFAVVYAALAGFSVPTQRACVMLVVAAVLLAGSKRMSAASVLSIALVMVLSLDPVASLSAGTWLSFLAVGVLIFLARRDKDLRPRSKKISQRSLTKMMALGRLQIFLVILLSVPVALSFSQVSVISPLVNFILIPVFSVTVVPVLLLAVLLLPVSVLAASVLLTLEHQWLEVIWTFLQWGSTVPLGSSEIHINVWQSAVMAIFLLLLLLPKGLVSKSYAGILLLPLVFGFARSVDDSVVLNMQVYDVGQGLSVLLQTRNHQLLYDTGPAFASGGSVAEWVLIPDFKAGNRQDLSALVISHSDKDHAGGHAAIVETLQPLRVFSPKNDPLKNSEDCVAGQAWVWDGVGFEFLYPFASTQSKNNNNYSCVLQVSVDGQRILLTGDIEKAAEYALLTRYTESGAEYDSELNSDFVFAPHHGSRSSSTPEFIAAVQAQQVIFPAGFANRWGFPKADVVARWQASGAASDNIAHTGQLAWSFKRDGSVERRVWIAHECRYWHQDCE